MTGIKSTDKQIKLSEIGIKCSGTRIKSSGTKIKYDGRRIKSRGMRTEYCEMRTKSHDINKSHDIKIKCYGRGLNMLAKAVVSSKHMPRLQKHYLIQLLKVTSQGMRCREI